MAMPVNAPRGKVGIASQGSQFTFKIKEIAERLGFRTEVFPISDVMDYLKDGDPQALFLSGGHHSVYKKDAVLPPKEIFSWRRKDSSPLPIMGICYGMQAMAVLLGGEVEAGIPEYGPVKLRIIKPGTPLLCGTPEEQIVYANHRDCVVKVPIGFTAYGYTSGDVLAAMGNGFHEAVQFHPEVTHTRHGEQMIRNFLERIAGCQRDYAPRDESDFIREQLVEAVGKGILIIPWSAGIDSATVAGHVPDYIKDRTTLFNVDCGNQQYGDREHQEKIAKLLGFRNLFFLDGGEELEVALAHTIDAEEKRAIHKRIYIRKLVEGVQRAIAGRDVKVALADGSNRADTIESGKKDGQLMKSHHNLGINWEQHGIHLVTPIAHLFKHQVRNVGRAISLPEYLCTRRPHPGPGNMLRVVGTHATRARMALTAEMAYEAEIIIERAGHWDGIAQMPVGYFGVKTVGNQGESRVYENAAMAGFRPVQTDDFMTSEPYYLPREVEEEILAMARSKPGINRGFFDYNPKPPATIEWE